MGQLPRCRGGRRRKKIADPASEERFLIELAGHLKIGTVNELIARLDAREFGHWRIAYRLGLFGSRQEDYRAGIVAASAGNAGRLSAMAQGAKLHGEPFSVADFFPALRSRRSKEDRQREVGKRMKMWRRYLVGAG